ncbi:MAG: rRNA maturation RNase YbeY [Epsilonproteobacteria bacterium]|nr:rRNA maturation RNase YbeY [Campylobacterota bacterium]
MKSEKINVINSTDNWPLPERRIIDIMIFAVGTLGIEGEIDLLLTDDKLMKKYNKKYRSIDNSTDVLSFSVPENEFVLPEEKIFGNIMISWEQLAGDAKEIGVDADEMMARLIIHAVLHLSGYDHLEAHERMLMQKEEAKLLSLYKLHQS